MEVAFREELRDKIKELLSSFTLDFFYSEEFATNSSESSRSLLEQELQKFDSGIYSSSVSHTSELGGAAMIEKTEGQVGFDLEETKRVTSAVALRIGNEKQSRIAPSPASIFVAKEAAFKALRGPRQPNVLSEVEIISWERVEFLPPLYRFTAQLKTQGLQWVGVVYEDRGHTVGLCRFPHST